MEIKEFQEWYRFLVPIPFQDSESEQEFLQRAYSCLDAFFQRYTEIPKEQLEELNPLRESFYGKSGLEKLKGDVSAWSFEDFRLRGMHECDVDFYVGTPQDNYGQIGIDILTNANKPEQKPKVDFLRRLWREFEYNF